MRATIRFISICIAALLAAQTISCDRAPASGELTVHTPSTSATEQLPSPPVSSSEGGEQVLLENLHVGEDALGQWIERAREYELPAACPSVTAIAIPHHLTAGYLISGALDMLKQTQETYDSVIIVAPNHQGDLADIVYSRADWEVFGGTVECDAELSAAILDGGINTASIRQSDARLEEDHSCSALIPFIAHYMPDARVAPVLVSRTISLENTLVLTHAIYEAAANSGKRVLLLCSIDFSHYLTATEAYKMDEQTLDAINTRNLMSIHEMSNHYMDSPATLNVFLQYLSLSGLRDTHVLDHTDASEFLGAVAETTTYFVLCG